MFQLWAGLGQGKTTVLRELHRTLGGHFLNLRDIVEATPGHHPLALEDTFYRLAVSALRQYNHVIIDDLHLLADVVSNNCNHYPRSGLLSAQLKVLATLAAESGGKLIYALGHGSAGPFHAQRFSFSLPEFDAADYAHLCHAFLDHAVADRLDYAKLHRFAPRLSAADLKHSCLWLSGDEGLDTDRFLDHLRARELTSNVDLEEVDEVDISDLKGVEDVLQALERDVVVPLENDALATELGLKPKRGVLLLGPPGTGKTTVGRALAHRLKGKFFRIDGTFLADGGGFIWKISDIFERAKQNAPAVIFIDDSDVLFEDGRDSGLYRYLLTALDGLESESVGRVCVMMTAMDVAGLPPALIRSGRIELWLEMRLPDAAARAAILRRHLATMPDELRSADVQRLAAGTPDFTGADLKRVAEDAKLLLAQDKASGAEPRQPASYFLAAAKAICDNKARYREAEARAHQRLAARPRRR